MRNGGPRPWAAACRRSGSDPWPDRRVCNALLVRRGPRDEVGRNRLRPRRDIQAFHGRWPSIRDLTASTWPVSTIASSASTAGTNRRTNEKPFSGSSAAIVEGELAAFSFSQIANQLAVNSSTHDLYVMSGSPGVAAYQASGEPANFTAGPAAGTNVLLCERSLDRRSDLHRGRRTAHRDPGGRRALQPGRERAGRRVRQRSKRAGGRVFAVYLSRSRRTARPAWSTPTRRSASRSIRPTNTCWSTRAARWPKYREAASVPPTKEGNYSETHRADDRDPRFHGEGRSARVARWSALCAREWCV